MGLQPGWWSWTQLGTWNRLLQAWQLWCTNVFFLQKGLSWDWHCWDWSWRINPTLYDGGLNSGFTACHLLLQEACSFSHELLARITSQTELAIRTYNVVLTPERIFINLYFCCSLFLTNAIGLYSPRCQYKSTWSPCSPIPTRCPDPRLKSHQLPLAPFRSSLVTGMPCMQKQPSQDSGDFFKGVRGWQIELLSKVPLFLSLFFYLFLSNYFPLPLFSSGLCYKKLTYENYKLKALLLSGWVQLMRVIGRTLEGRRKGEAREFLSSILSVLGWIFGRDCVSPKVPAHFKVYPSWAEFLEVATSLGFLYCTALPCKLLMFRQI